MLGNSRHISHSQPTRGEVVSGILWPTARVWLNHSGCSQQSTHSHSQGVVVHSTHLVDCWHKHLPLAQHAERHARQINHTKLTQNCCAGCALMNMMVLGCVLLARPVSDVNRPSHASTAGHGMVWARHPQVRLGQSNTNIELYNCYTWQQARVWVVSETHLTAA